MSNQKKIGLGESRLPLISTLSGTLCMCPTYSPVLPRQRETISEYEAEPSTTFNQLFRVASPHEHHLHQHRIRVVIIMVICRAYLLPLE